MMRFVSKPIFKIIFLTAVFGLLVFLNPVDIFSLPRPIFYGAAYPFEKFFSGLSWKAREIGQAFSLIGKLKEENKRLYEENIVLLSENARLKDIEKENENLRQQLDLLPREKFDLELAQVISYDPGGSGDWVMIDRGAEEGLEKGMAVISGKGIMVGRLEEVFRKTARVIFVTSPDSAVGAVVSVSEAKGIIKGEYGTSLILDMVLQNDTLNVGDDVITSGMSGAVPRGLFLGKIIQIRQSSDKLFQQASVNSPLDFSKLRFVAVVKKNNEN